MIIVGTFLREPPLKKHLSGNTVYHSRLATTFGKTQWEFPKNWNWASLFYVVISKILWYTSHYSSKNIYKLLKLHWHVLSEKNSGKRGLFSDQYNMCYHWTHPVMVTKISWVCALWVKAIKDRELRKRLCSHGWLADNESTAQKILIIVLPTTSTDLCFKIIFQ